VRVRTTSGDLGFEGKLAKGASVDAETVSGDLTVRAVPESGMDYEVSTFSGDIRNCMGAEAEARQQVRSRPPFERNPRQCWRQTRREFRLKTMSGDVGVVRQELISAVRRPPPVEGLPSRLRATPQLRAAPQLRAPPNSGLPQAGQERPLPLVNLLQRHPRQLGQRYAVAL